MNEENIKKFCEENDCYVDVCGCGCGEVFFIPNSVPTFEDEWKNLYNAIRKFLTVLIKETRVLHPVQWVVDMISGLIEEAQK